MPREKTIDAWHFVAGDRRLGYGDGNHVAPGYVYSAKESDGPLVMCQWGMHASRDPFDALQYAPGPWLCKVRCWGEVQERDDKLVARHREVVAMRDLSAELRLFACWCVRHTPLGGDQTTWSLVCDERSKNAVVVSERFANGGATTEDLTAAWAAAWAAARAAARDAARDAQRCRFREIVSKALRDNTCP